jgi:type I site-specific restriction endonuclease
MTKVKDRTADKSYEVYLALYQAVTGSKRRTGVQAVLPDF